MAIETISGSKRYKVSEADPCCVLVQDKPGARWKTFWDCRTPEHAKQLVLQMAHDVYGENGTEGA